MDIETVGVSPVGDGKHTDITISMSAKDAARFIELYAKGELAELGVISATVVSGIPMTDRTGQRTDRLNRRQKPTLKENSPDSHDRS